MDLAALRDRLTPTRWPLLLALALALYSAALLAWVEVGSRRQLADTNAWLVSDSQRRARALADVLDDLHAAALAHAELPEIRAYLASRDLGMSPLYGLNAARGTIEARLQARAEEFGARWEVARPRIVHWSADGQVLADTAPQAGTPPPPVLPGHPQGLRIDVRQGTLLHVVAVPHKGQADGHVVTQGTLDVLHRNLLGARPGSSQGHLELLLAEDGRLPAGREAELQLQGDALQRLAQAAEDQVLDTASRLAPDAAPPLLENTLMIRTRVPGAPLLLVTFMPRQLAHGHLQSRTVILGAGVLLVVMVAGAFRLERMRRRAEQLTAEVAAAEQQRALTEFRNRELTDEIARRRAVEAALAESEQRWQLAVAGTNDGIWDWNIGSGELFMSDRWLSMVGYRPGELPARNESWSSLLHPDDAAATQQRLQEHLDGRSAFYKAEFRMRCRDGGERWILARGKAQFDAQGRPVRMTGSHTDVTERHEAQARLHDHSEQLNAIFELSPDAFISFDGLRRVRFVNRAFQDLAGLQAAEVVGLDEEAFSQRLAGLGQAEHGFPGVAALRAALAAGDAGAGPRGRAAAERHVFRLQGAPQRVVQAALHRAEAANVSQVLTLRDITRETEVDRMKSEFLTTAAHELRTPMTSIYGFVSLLRMREMDAARRRDLLDTVLRQSDLMIAIINQLLDLARIEAKGDSDFALVPATLQTLAEACVADFRPPSGRSDPLVEPCDTPCPVTVDLQKMQQALLNVLSNAYKYSPQGGDVRLRFRQDADAAGWRRVGVAVRDAGIGMTPEQAARACERFYRADASGHIPGTGLGMSIVKEIVELHHGEVQIDSAPGQGTEVTLWLPARVGGLSGVAAGG